jgi:hypothetical protein
MTKPKRRFSQKPLPANHPLFREGWSVYVRTGTSSSPTPPETPVTEGAGKARADPTADAEQTPEYDKRQRPVCE